MMTYMTASLQFSSKRKHEKKLTWRHTRGNGGGRQVTLTFGGHTGHLNGVGSECGQSGDPVLLCNIGQVMRDASVCSVEFLPGNAIPCRHKTESCSADSQKIRRNR